MAVCFLPLLLPGQHDPTSQGTVEIHGISVEEKINGAVIRIHKTGEIDPSEIAGWTSKSGWFYVTLLGGRIDTTVQIPFVGTGIISGFQSAQLQESAQLSFKLSRGIESFEIDSEGSPGEIVVTLRLPLEETLAAMQRLKSVGGEDVSSDELGPPGEATSLKDRLSYALILTGAGFVASGLYQSDGRQFLFGSTLLFSGYLLLNKAPHHARLTE